MSSDRVAPGDPGIAARWTSSAKSGVGTAIGNQSRVWFTLSHGICNEIYYPCVDQACVRDMELIVTDRATLFSEEKRDADSVVRWLADAVPAFGLTNSSRDGRYRIEKQILTDPHRDKLLQQIRFNPLAGHLSDYRLHVLLAPHLGNQGGGNNAWVSGVDNARTGPTWHRYNDDGYGEHEDGSPFDGTGIGRGWPLLTGERAHYELAAGRIADAKRLLTGLESFANDSGLTSEQVWNSADIPERELQFGRPTGSEMPLVPTAKILRVELMASATVHCTCDDCKTAADITTRDAGLGIHWADLPTETLPEGSQVTITFHWSVASRWEGTDFVVRIAAARTNGLTSRNTAQAHGK